MVDLTLDQSNPQPRYSIVIPVYNSGDIVGRTVDRTVAFVVGAGWDYELILVCDGSRDNSWDVISQKARSNPRVQAVNLLRNYGQHTAVLCGLNRSSGQYVLTLDDDLQNPPEELATLVRKAEEGHDVVFGRFREKRHPLHRRLGARFIQSINRRVFHTPPDIVPTNFRCLRRDAVERICDYRTAFPYITGLAILCAASPANVSVAHEERASGKSTYNHARLLKLALRILLSYSTYPLRVVILGGLLISGVSLTLALFYFIRAVSIGTTVPGWATTVILVSASNGVVLLTLSMLGEYLMRILSQISQGQYYQIKEVISARD